jgi:Flp pilus assembly protein TadD
LGQAEVASRLVPNDDSYLTALGMAQFRVGQYREAVATLMQAAQLQADLPCGRDPANLAFLALSQHHLGQQHEARATLNRLREALSSRGQAWNQQGQGLLREAEALELDLAFPPDPFAH